MYGGRYGVAGSLWGCGTTGQQYLLMMALTGQETHIYQADIHTAD
jgi:hypothetical protein